MFLFYGMAIGFMVIAVFFVIWQLFGKTDNDNGSKAIVAAATLVCSLPFMLLGLLIDSYF